VAFVRVVGPTVQLPSRIPTDPYAHPSWTEEAVRLATGLSAPAYLGRLRDRHGAQQAALCLHVNQAALSYNLAYYDGVRSEFEAERMVCFSSYPDGRPTTAATYAHEILHLFGAGDLYFPYDDTPERKSEAGRWFPHDIMYRVDYDINRLRIGPFTAYRVGWKPSLDPQWQHLED
jgi:hypothetical protein